MSRKKDEKLTLRLSQGGALPYPTPLCFANV